MACCLVPSTTSKEDFTAKVKCEVTLTLKGPSGAGAKIVHLRYDEDEVDSAPPLQFTVKTGPRMLVVLFEASKPGALMQLIEDCGGGNQQVIDRVHFDPMNPARGYIIRGA
jgi:hypothetical protein